MKEGAAVLGGLFRHRIGEAGPEGMPSGPTSEEGLFIGYLEYLLGQADGVAL